ERVVRARSASSSKIAPCILQVPRAPRPEFWVAGRRVVVDTAGGEQVRRQTVEPAPASDHPGRGALQVRAIIAWSNIQTCVPVQFHPPPPPGQITLPILPIPGRLRPHLQYIREGAIFYSRAISCASIHGMTGIHYRASPRVLPLLASARRRVVPL